MRGVVLPFVAALDVVNSVTPANICIPVEVVIHVDVDVAATPATTPTPTAAPRRSDRHAYSERNRARGHYRAC